MFQRDALCLKFRDQHGILGCILLTLTFCVVMFINVNAHELKINFMQTLNTIFNKILVKGKWI